MTLYNKEDNKILTHSCKVVLIFQIQIKMKMKNNKLEMT